MRYGILVILSFVARLYGSTLFAQHSEPVTLKVLYEFVHVNDTTQREKRHHEEMVLYIGQDASLYKTYTIRRIQQHMRKQLDDPAFDGNLMIAGQSNSSSESYYFRHKGKGLVKAYNLAGSTYLVEEEFPQMDWKIMNESKEIAGFMAQKATTRFKGREYEVWFTTEIPFNVGPWKLHGLPGLILEAYDSRGEVSFKVIGLEEDQEEETLALPPNGIKTSKKALDKLIDAYSKDPETMRKAQASGNGGLNTFSDRDMAKIKSVNVQKTNVYDTSPTTNNPLEISDN